MLKLINKDIRYIKSVDISMNHLISATINNRNDNGINKKSL